MPYQISRDRKDRSDLLQAIIIKSEPSNEVYNKQFVDFVFDVAKNCCTEEMSIELITANKYDMLLETEKYLNQAIDYKAESDYNQMWNKSINKAAAGESVVLTYYMGDTEDNNCDFRSLLNIISLEKTHVKVIVTDDKIVPAVPDWVENTLKRRGVKRAAGRHRETGWIKMLCSKISTAKDRIVCEWYDLFNNAFFFKLILFHRDNCGSIFPKLESVSIDLGEEREEKLKDLGSDALEIYNRVIGEKCNVLSKLKDAQNELIKLRRRLCGMTEIITSDKPDTKVLSQLEASNFCNISDRAWRDAFDVTKESEKQTLYAVAVGMRMSYKDLKWLMWCKGYVMKPSHNITDAVVTIFVRGFRHKSSIDINEVNLILLALNQKTLGEDIMKRTKK